MKKMVTIFALLLYLLITGCATPMAVKDASTKHTNNLANLQLAVKNYKKEITGYYNRLIEQQRQAFIAQHINESVKDIATKQSKSISIKMQNEPNSQEPALDFISVGADIADQFITLGDRFDFWIHGTKSIVMSGELAARKIALQDRLKTEKNPRLIKILEAAIEVPDDYLSYVETTISLKKQQKNIELQIDLLAKQVATMQVFHAKIDEYLSINATIDGAKIAKAAAAGSNSKLLESFLD